MFQSATIKLTGLYLLIILMVSIFFSANLYRLSTKELDRGLRDQAIHLQDIPGYRGTVTLDDLLKFRQGQLDAGKRRILISLLKTNIAIILLGGIGSYLLARRTLQPIQEAHDAQVRFTADASHELRTPLTAMQAEIEVALRDSKLTNPQARLLLKSNLEETGKLTLLAQGLLELARHDDRSVLSPVSLREVVTQGKKRVEPLRKQKDITISDKVDNETLAGHEQPLVQLVTILLDNALKYSGPKTAITLTSRADAKAVHLSVADQGRGIPAADLPKIFSRFYRADESRSKAAVDGYGLGLSIAEKIAKAHHGGISVASTVGVGSVFTVTLPRFAKRSTAWRQS